MLVGSGIEIRPGRIPGIDRHELGLFATQPILKNQLITEYDGELIDYKRASELQKSGQDTHLRTIHASTEFIDGRLVSPPFEGRGGGSFANDLYKTPSLNNAKFIVIPLRHGVAPPQGIRDRVFLKAKRNIHVGEEITVSYGRNYWKRRS